MATTLRTEGAHEVWPSAAAELRFLNIHQWKAMLVAGLAPSC